jgi:MFS family permease
MMSSLLIPLAGTVAAQTAAAMLLLAIPVLGPALTEMLELAPERVGLLTGASAVGIVWFMTVSRLFLGRFGPLRSLQIGLTLGAMALLSFAATGWPLILLAAFLVGAGYAPNAPASSVILTQISTRRQMSLVFSIKQAAVPLGGVLSGLLVPFMLTHAGLEMALVAVAIVPLMVAMLVQPLRPRFDGIADAKAPFGLRALINPANVVHLIKAVGGVAELRLLTASGVAFSVMQGAIFGFLVTHLIDGVGLAYTTAGFCFSIMATSSVVSRLAIGGLASALDKPRQTLAALGIAGFVIALISASLSPAWPLWALMVASALSGVAAGSWNGIYLGEIARAAPEGEIGQATAGSTFFVFIGYALGPVVFSTLVTLSGGYVLPYVLSGLGVLVAGIMLAIRSRIGSRSAVVD